MTIVLCGLVAGAWGQRLMDAVVQERVVSNRLRKEASAYLRQHMDNPVDWYPWCQEAFQRARAEDKPIFLSIGYSACHWCHVMAHESFEDVATAAYMNEHFVNIKVDREERPDLDAIYMEAVVAMTGRGGWPMSVFLTPTQEPFYGGTYFPLVEWQGMPSFMQVLASVARAYREQRGQIEQVQAQVMARLVRSTPFKEQAAQLDSSALREAFQNLWSQFDNEYGGFGSAP